MVRKITYAVLAGVISVGCVGAAKVHAQSEESLFGIKSRGLTFGPYVRVELGYDLSLVEDGFWDPPGSGDPRIFFDLSGDNAAFSSVAAGFDWMNGFRADLSFSYFSGKDIAGDWSRTEPPSPGPHANMAAEVSTFSVMGNVFYSPFEASGRNSTFSPYVTMGAGFAVNRMADWTRINQSNLTRPTRQFEGGTNTDLAWSVGVGMSWRTKAFGSREALIDASIRYYDLGRAVGGATPLPGNGSEAPRTPLTIDMESTVVSIGVRIPLQR